MKQRKGVKRKPIDRPRLYQLHIQYLDGMTLNPTPQLITLETAAFKADWYAMAEDVDLVQVIKPGVDPDRASNSEVYYTTISRKSKEMGTTHYLGKKTVPGVLDRFVESLRHG